MSTPFKVGDRVWFRYRSDHYHGDPMRATILLVHIKRRQVVCYRIKLDAAHGGSFDALPDRLTPMEALDLLAEA